MDERESDGGGGRAPRRARPPREQDAALAPLVLTSAAVASTRKRSEKIALLAGCLARLPAERAGTAASLLAGILPGPPPGVGFARLRAALPERAAAEPGLTLGDVERALSGLAAIEGTGAVERKISTLRALLERATEEEQSFLVRLLAGELRQGALEGIVLEAVARAFEVPLARVRRAHMLSGDLAETARTAAAGGAEALARVGLRPLRAVHPMLASPAESLAEALARHGRALLEWKLDGVRIQAHKQGPEVRIFTRTLRDVTGALPEVRAAVASLGAESVVLDGEAIALSSDGRPRPFQETMSRFGAEAPAPDLFAPVSQPGELSAFFFDVLHLDGRTLIDRPLVARREALVALVPARHLLPSLETDSPEEAEAFLREARAAGHEGVMAKDPGSRYEAGRRGRAWLKVKPARTLDLVVLAVERGSGRRSGWWSNIHLGARDEESGELVMLGKTFKGMSDETLRWQTETFPRYAVRDEGWVMFLRPAIVAEIAFNEIQRSSRYPGGLALRFARLVRYRPDKTPEEADTIQTVRSLYATDAEEGPPG
ncbi:MAG TPA: ATP-dependent DNA ligase [Longimicrobiales bacterium]|nr:ATP-dependent DNA ligase [Longimicrobiales bacterium]